MLNFFKELTEALTEAMGGWGSPGNEAGEGVSPLTPIPEYPSSIKCGPQKSQSNGEVAVIN